MALTRRVITAPALRPAARPVYSYVVTPTGLVSRKNFGTNDARITFHGDVAKKSGQSRSHLVIVENSQEQPDLVRLIDDALLLDEPLRVLVSFDRIMTGTGKVKRLRAVARIEELLPPPVVDDRQFALAF